MRRLLPYALALFTAGCEIIGLDDREGPPSEVMVGGLRWTARAHTFWTAPERVQVNVVAHNDGNVPITIYWGGCDGAQFRVFRREGDSSEIFDSTVPLSNTPTGCPDVLYGRAIAPKDSFALSTNADVTNVVSSAGTYFITAEARIGSIGAQPQAPFKDVQIPEIRVGPIALNPQRDPLPPVRLHNGLETTTTSFLRNDSVIVRASYRNTTGSSLRIHRNTVCQFGVWGYADRGSRDHTYLYEVWTGAVHVPADRCDDPPFTDVPPGETRSLERATAVQRLLATLSAGTYYLVVGLFSPDYRLQSAGEVQLH
jgi:hypothetical protein